MTTISLHSPARATSVPVAFRGGLSAQAAHTSVSAPRFDGPEFGAGVPRGYVLPAPPRFGSTSGPSEREALKKLAQFEAKFRQQSGFTLDVFQKQSVLALARGKSPVVAAPTSSGKTLVAEAAIEDALASGKRLFYTTPRKAISNEKYHEFVAQYGRDNVGLVTGDVSVNPDAPVVLMTTEIFRNMMYQPEENQKSLSSLQYVVFDECHFINDPERGTVWEEGALYARRELPNVQQIHLSATIDNARDYTAWLNGLNAGKTRAGEFELITSEQRPVPLSIQYLSTQGRLVDVMQDNGYPSREFLRAFQQGIQQYRQSGRAKQSSFRQAVPMSQFSPLHSVRTLQRQDRLPAIHFVFSRKRCQSYAETVLKANLHLTTEVEKAKIEQVIRAYTDTYPSMAGSALFPYLREGIAYHHADMWPREKELAEVLLKQGLLKTVFATGTLAEGVNVPAKSVVITDYQAGGDPLSGSTFRQITGRAGRRGMYERGYAVLAHPGDNDSQRLVDLALARPEAVQSQFQITPYMALNHIARLKNPAQIATLLNEGFSAYQLKQEQHEVLENTATHKRRKKLAGQFARAESPLKASFDTMRGFLEKTGFLKNGYQLTPLGELASQIPMESSLLIAKGIQAGALDRLSPEELAGVLAATVTESDENPKNTQGKGVSAMEADQKAPAVASALGELRALHQTLEEQAMQTGIISDIKLEPRYVNTVMQWSRTHDASLLKEAPGVMTYTVLRTANVLQHIAKSNLASVQLKETALTARRQLLGGMIEEQIRPRKVQID